MTKDQFTNEIIPLGVKVHRVAFRFIGDAEKVKDIVQSIYLKLWEKRKELEKVLNKEAFVVRMTRNVCLDNIRLTKINVDISDSNRAVESNYENKEAVNLVRQIIHELPLQQKRIIELRDIDGFTSIEIAEILDLSTNNVRVNLSIARKKIRSELRKIYDYGL